MDAVSAATSAATSAPCDAQMCHGHGRCVLTSNEVECECRLGYDGDFCENRVNEPIAVPLTLGVLGFIVGLVFLAFLLAFLKKRMKAHKRKMITEQKAEGMKESKGPL